MKLKELAAATLAVILGLGALPANAQDKGVVVDRSAIEQALTEKAQADNVSRDSIRTLLQREDVKAMAGNMGLDVRRAEGAVSTLQGTDLDRVAAQAATANDLLTTGGATTITISLVAVLLIVIIIILLTN
ncbi:MAG: hypothetical protein ABI672_11165, partial [Vicinamibacteria bacterium]